VHHIKRDVNTTDHCLVRIAIEQSLKNVKKKKKKEKSKVNKSENNLSQNKHRTKHILI
jgi:hypothetical protein